MNIKDLTEPQKQAMMDLAVLAMYADGHLAAAEDGRITRLLGAMGFGSDSDREKHYDASVSRVSRHCQTAEAARIHAATLAETFTSREQRRQVQEILDDIIKSDTHVSLNESSLLAVVKEALRI